MEKKMNDMETMSRYLEKALRLKPPKAETLILAIPYAEFLPDPAIENYLKSKHPEIAPSECYLAGSINVSGNAEEVTVKCEQALRVAKLELQKARGYVGDNH